MLQSVTTYFLCITAAEEKFFFITIPHANIAFYTIDDFWILNTLNKTNCSTYIVSKTKKGCKLTHSRHLKNI